MADKLDTLIAPKLDRKTHKPIPSTDNSEYEWEYWKVKDYPGHGAQGKNSNNWNENEWQLAFNIFEDRIYGRFLNIINRIEKRLFSGFAVMALDCLLCETLQQFYDGADESQSPTKDFIKFLTCSSFSQFFGNDRTPRTSMAAVFYDQIRCGILHQAEIKKTSLIEIDDKYSLVDWSDSQHTGLIVNRKKFHKQLIQEFNNYLGLLRNTPTKPNEFPWNKFKDKMDFICRA